MNSDQRHESFIGREGYDPSSEGNSIQAVYDMKSVQTVRPNTRIEDQLANAYAPIHWDKNMKDTAAISQPAAAKKYLAEMGLEEDCAVMTDPKLRVQCEKSKKESMELPPTTSMMRFQSGRKTPPHLKNRNDFQMQPGGASSSNSPHREINLATFDLESLLMMMISYVVIETLRAIYIHIILFYSALEFSIVSSVSLLK